MLLCLLNANFILLHVLQILKYFDVFFTAVFSIEITLKVRLVI